VPITGGIWSVSWPDRHWPRHMPRGGGPMA